MRAMLWVVLALAALAEPGDQGRRGGYRGVESVANPDYDGRFVFTRIRYPNGSWAHDYPRADQHLPNILKELTTIDPRLEASNVLDLDDPAIFLNPILYVSEPGFWTLSD